MTKKRKIQTEIKPIIPGKKIQFIVELPREIHRHLKLVALTKNVTMSGLVRDLIVKNIEKY